MTYQEHITKVIIPAIQAGDTEHSVVLLMAMIARAFRAGWMTYNPDDMTSTDDLIRHYMIEGWKNEN